jgi:hypothetical protein
LQEELLGIKARKGTQGGIGQQTFESKKSMGILKV